MFLLQYARALVYVYLRWLFQYLSYDLSYVWNGSLVELVKSGPVLTEPYGITPACPYDDYRQYVWRCWNIFNVLLF